MLHALVQHKPQEYLPADLPFGKVRKLIVDIPSILVAASAATLMTHQDLPSTSQALKTHHNLKQQLPLQLKCSLTWWQKWTCPLQANCSKGHIVSRGQPIGNKHHSGMVI
jgi:hypothetical protein